MKEQNSANPSPGTATPSPLYKPHKKARKTELELKLYDIAETYSSLEKTLHDPFFLSSDLIVAGAFVHPFPALDSFSRRHEIPLLHPFSERDSMAVGNPWFMQTSAPTLFQIQEVAGFVKANFAQACKIVISDSSIQEIAKAKSLQEMIPGSKRWLFNEITEILLKDLPTDTPVVIIPFYQEEITAVKTFLPLRPGKGNITLIAPATWLEYSTTDVDYFLQNNLTVYSTFVTDKDTPEFKDFARKYYLLYNSIPSSLAYQGYRIFSWLLPMLEEHNADFMRHIEDGENPFHLQERPGLKGFESQNIRFFKLTETGEPFNTIYTTERLRSSKVPKQANGSVNLNGHTSSTREMIGAVMELYNRIVDPSLLVRRMSVTANHLLAEQDVIRQATDIQLDLFSDRQAEMVRQAARERERRMQQALVAIRKRYGKNAVLKGMSYGEGATARERNGQIGGHRA